MEPVAKITLYSDEGNSDKIYKISMEPVATGGYVVNFAHGRRGDTLRTGTKTQQPVSYAQAWNIYGRLVAEKKTGKSHYREIGDDGQPIGTVDPTDTGLRPQLLNPIAGTEVGYYLNSPIWWAQEKKDGRRRLVWKENGILTAINRKGLAVAISNIIMDRLKEVPVNFVIDGEDMGEMLYVFDRIDGSELPYSVRLGRLQKLGLDGPDSPVKTVYTATTREEKNRLYERLCEIGAEGIVFKRHQSPYMPGRPASGGDQVKFKFYNTAAVLVTGHNQQRSVAIAIGSDLIPVGNVTIPANQPIPPIGSVIEVRYLYAYPGGSLYQPVCMGIRDDVETDGLADLKYKQAKDN